MHTPDYTDIQYARVLGFRKGDSDVLTVIKNASAIPLLTKLTATKDLSDSAVHMLNQDIYASNLYESIVTDKFKTSFINEYEHAIIRV